MVRRATTAKIVPEQEMPELRERVPASPLHADGSEVARLLGASFDSPATRPRISSSRVRSYAFGQPHAFRELRLRWTLLRTRYKVFLCVLFAVFCLNVVVGCIDFIGSKPLKQENVSSESSFAVVINTYKRPTQLRDAVKHYAESCGRRVGVGQVFVVWAELDVAPPTVDSLFNREAATRRKPASDNRSTTEIIRVPKDSLNSRFLPIDNLQTTSIFMVDDDIRVDCGSLHRAFTAWKAFPDSMVGFYPRLSLPGRDGGFVYHSWPIVFWRQQINFILTKACFLHSKYLSLYTNEDTHPAEIKQYVDDHKNCEDIAMSMLVANVTRGSRMAVPAMPIYVHGAVSDEGLFNGISTGSGHMAHRSSCLGDLISVYQKRGWGIPLEERFSLKAASWIQHQPGFSWQYRPSNFFEWFAFGNIFK